MSTTASTQTTGTVLQERGIPIDDCLELANVERPDLVRQLHFDYLAAGVDIIQTNTFGASRVRLRAYGAGDRVVELNEAGVRLAREAAAGAVREDGSGSRRRCRRHRARP